MHEYIIERTYLKHSVKELLSFGLVQERHHCMVVGRVRRLGDGSVAVAEVERGAGHASAHSPGDRIGRVEGQRRSCGVVDREASGHEGSG